MLPFVLLLFSSGIWADSTMDNLQTLCLTLAQLNNASHSNATANISNSATNTTEKSNFSFSSQYLGAQSRLETANQSVQRLKEADYPYLRAYDLYLVAQQWLEGQAALEEKRA